MKNYIAAVFCFLTLIFAGCEQVRSQQVQPKKIPDFTFTTLNGKPFTRTNITAGKKSLIILFDISCEHCQHEIGDIGKRYAEFKNVNFYLVSMDDKTEIVRFMNQYGKNLKDKKNVTLLYDGEREFIPKFMPTKFPAMYVYSEKGDLVEYFGGQKDLNEVLKALKK